MKMKIKISHCNSFKAIAIKNEDKQICTFVEIDLRPFFFFFCSDTNQPFLYKYENKMLQVFNQW